MSSASDELTLSVPPALSVSSLIGELGLSLAAGEGPAAERPIRWVHISEIVDPTPWLVGRELLLTTGMRLDTAKRQRDFVRLLAANDLAGLGFGVGFGHDELPAALLAEARELSFPLFEVPFEMPFIAITEAAFSRLVNAQYDVVSRGLAVNERLERLVLEGGGLGQMASEIAAAVHGSVIVLDRGGRALAEGGRELPAVLRESISSQVVARSFAAPFAPRLEEESAEGTGHALAHPVSPRGGAADAWLVAIGHPGELGDFERLCVQQGAIVIALELMRQRVASETERRLSGDVLTGVLSGRLAAADLRDRLAPFGLTERAAVLGFQLSDPADALSTLESEVAATGRPALVGIQAAGGMELLCALIDPGDSDPVELATPLRRTLEAAHGPTRAAASSSQPIERARQAFHEARFALEATALTNGSSPEVVSHRDLGAFTLLVGVQDTDALRLYCEQVLGAIESMEGSYGDELLQSLEAFINRNGHWERAAADCYCHRHTLRYRIKRIEELTGRDLSNARDRIEMWLALRARELIP